MFLNPNQNILKFEEKYKWLIGEEYGKECGKHILRSINHELHLHETKKSTISFFDDKRCYKSNIKTEPWK